MRTTAVHIKSLLVSLICIVLFAPAPANSEEFGGFGIVVAQLYDAESPDHLGGIVVLHVFPDSEALKAGMQAGDVIWEVDGKPTEGRPFKDIIFDSLRGEVGSSSIVKIRRVPEEEPISFTVKRSRISHEPKSAN